MTDPIHDQPADDTAAVPAAPPAPPAAAVDEPGPEPAPPPAAATPDRPPDDPPLKAAADRPADPGWREPPWIPRRDRGQRPSSLAAIVVGLALVVVGLWFFLDRTLGIDLPRVSWSSLWPLILIVIGAVVVVRSFERK